VEDLSLHILDIVENAIRAQAQHVRISVREDLKQDVLSIEIEDDGAGMSEDFMRQAVRSLHDHVKRHHALAWDCPCLSRRAKMCDGEFSIFSEKGAGTKVHATFRHSHIDRKPWAKYRTRLSP